MAANESAGMRAEVLLVDDAVTTQAKGHDAGILDN